MDLCGQNIIDSNSTNIYIGLSLLYLIFKCGLPIIYGLRTIAHEREIYSVHTEDNGYGFPVNSKKNDTLIPNFFNKR